MREKYKREKKKMLGRSGDPGSEKPVWGLCKSMGFIETCSQPRS